MTQPLHPLTHGAPDAFDVLGGLRLVNWLVAIVLGTAILVGIVQQFYQGGVKVGPILLFALGMAAWGAVRARHARAAALLFCWGSVLACYLAAYAQAGLLGSAWAALPITTMASGWLLARRHTYALVLVTALMVAVFYVLHRSGASFTTPSLEVLAFSYAINPVLGAIIGLQSGAAFRARYLESEELRHELAISNAELEQRVAERSASLQRAVDDIKRMQSEIIESEKLASLGALVAGISHELNTPIGNALTVSTALEDMVAGIESQIVNNTVRRQDLMRSMAEFREAAGLISSSLLRSAELISSFKQVSIDQTSERRRQFQLATMIGDVVKTLEPSLRKSACHLALEVPPDIDCDTYPGPLGQVVGNLVLNAVHHAFEGKPSGELLVQACLVGDDVHLTVRDDGLGMSESVQTKAFEPFFTTKMGRGGSGLGLAVCHRICTKLLGGSIRVQSSPGLGSTFLVTFPRVAPGKVG